MATAESGKKPAEHSGRDCNLLMGPRKWVLGRDLDRMERLVERRNAEGGIHVVRKPSLDSGDWVEAHRKPQ